MVLLLARLPQELEGAAEIGVAGEHRQEARADVLQLHRRLSAALDDDRSPPRNAVLAQCRGQLDKRPDVLGAEIHVDAAVGVVPEIDPLAAMRHRVAIEQLVATAAAIAGSPPLASSTSSSGQRGHHLVARQARPPLRARHLAIHRCAADPQRLVRLDDRGGDVVRPQRRQHPRGEGGMARRHDLAAQIKPLRVPDRPGLAGIGRILRLELLLLLLGQHGRARPDDEVGRLPAHQLRPEPRALVENVVEVEANLARNSAARVEVEPLDLDQGRVGIGNIPADDGMAAGLQRTGQIETHRLRDLDEILALGHALHAVDADPGEIVPGLGDQRVTVRRLQLAECGQRLLEGERQAGKAAGKEREHAHAPEGG